MKSFLSTPYRSPLSWINTTKPLDLKTKIFLSVSKEMEVIYQIQGDVRCNYLVQHQILSKDSKILDIGSGYGYMFKSLRNKGFKEMSFFATDPSPIYLKKLRALGVNTCDSLNEVVERNFDLVTLAQVLEHIPNPNSFLESVMTLIKDGGHIYIDVPDRDDTHKEILESHTLFYSVKSNPHYKLRREKRKIYST